MRGRVAVLLLIVCAMVFGLAGSGSATFRGPSGSVVFQSKRGGGYDLYVSRLDGTGTRRLLKMAGDQFNAGWNPGGNTIVFQSGKSGSDFDIYLVNEGGSGLKRLVGGPTVDAAPQFCNGGTIVFHRQPAPGATEADIYSFDIAKKTLLRLTDDPARESFATCSPDGKRVAFISSRDGEPSIYEVQLSAARPLGTVPAATPVRLTDGVALDPDYSPDGTSLAYVAPDPTDGNTEVFRKNLATGVVTQVTFTSPPVQNRLPKFARPALRSARVQAALRH